MQRLKQRADFLATAAGVKVPASAFVLQARNRADGLAKQDLASDVRVGFTVTKKVGNAVERNRIRRRLREIVRLAKPDTFSAGHDYVLIGRRAALTLPFGRIAEDFSGVMRRLHAGRQAAKRETKNA